MKVSKLEDGKLLLEFTLEEGRKIDRQISEHTADDMPSAALSLASVLRAAWYGGHDDFRQPPHAWDADSPKPPSID